MGRKNILVNGMHLIRSKNIEITTFLEGKNDNEQKDKGYTIVDIKADQTDPDRKRSIFFFKNEDGILDMVKKICKEK